MKRFHKLLGREGEKIAERYLNAHGLVTVRRNFTCRHAELDLVMLDGGDLVFAEVKTMTEISRREFGDPAEKVDRKKRERITLAAAEFLSRFPHLAAEGYPRFDVVEVTLRTDGATVRHTKHAFEATSGFYKRKLL